MDDYTKQALELVKGQTSIKTMTSDEMMSMIEDVASKLRRMSGVQVAMPVEEPEEKEIKLQFDPKKAIKDKSVTCCLCGAQVKVLTAKHLEKHGLTPEEYRRLCGYPLKHPLIAKELASARKVKMQEMQLWKRKGGNGDVSGNLEEEKMTMDDLADAVVADRGKRRKKIESGVGEDAHASEPTIE